MLVVGQILEINGYTAAQYEGYVSKIVGNVTKVVWSISNGKEKKETALTVYEYTNIDLTHFKATSRMWKGSISSKQDLVLAKIKKLEADFEKKQHDKKLVKKMVNDARVAPPVIDRGSTNHTPNYQPMVDQLLNQGLNPPTQWVNLTA